MTLYTVIPMEQVFEGAIQLTQPLEEINFQGLLMQVEPLERGQARIVRLLDCPLEKYLDPALSPGAIISRNS
ncbi:YlzJ-like family protein [Paenibacillus sp. S150]|uniref:YlzJ-like family protein n=1 Tax=Paenibacillus sp. S150 TaxID=2749826 RepID=UPI001C568849|nr:YlzJ-like family protein [Paenibacillus sp. S150]MBW4083307.1 YlzJ-like family protein [Paenibacillus sp. S150]